MDECQICKHERSRHKNPEEGYAIQPDLGKHWCEYCHSSEVSFHTFKRSNLYLIEKAYNKTIGAKS